MEEEIKKEKKINKSKNHLRRVSFNEALPHYKEKMESRKLENWWEKNFPNSKVVESEKVKKKLISYLMLEMKKDELLSKFLYETYVESEVSCEQEGFIAFKELSEVFSLHNIDQFFNEKGNKITKYHVVCSSDDYDVESFFSENVPGYNEVDGDGSTPLHYACCCGLSVEKIQFLIQNKSEVNIRNNSGETPLNFAIKNGASQEVIKLLLEKNADPNILDNEGMNSLHTCFSNDIFDLDLVQLFLNHKCNPVVTDNNGCLPLNYAKNSDNYKDLKNLLL